MRTFNSFLTAAAADAFVTEHAHHLDWDRATVEERPQGDFHIVLHNDTTGEQVLAAYIVTPDPETTVTPAVWGTQDAAEDTRSALGWDDDFRVVFSGDKGGYVLTDTYGTRVMDADLPNTYRTH